ncbi:hypothetical protein [Thermoactinomyces sp. DSM 45892]|uniref:hypothetical protein n=1 Tax=Thermoactinomyces sp. DSM 45892 TaxID=1882753 RepID=UPI000898D3FB|nr:hypothetical protein [Thermoactinomyces sp. DSM 45892]SDZ16094.1 hypothetical protein SAMN05444416_1151 [Thermoactinomyces sp. DSM 45892]
MKRNLVKMKKYILTLTVSVSVLVTGLGTSLQAFASETNTPIVQNVKTNPEVLQDGVTQNGIRGYLVKLAAEAVAFAIRHGGSVVGELVKFLDGPAAKAFKKHSGTIADKIDDLANIPDVTAEIIKTRLYQFLKGPMNMNAGTAMQIADAIKWAINFFLF